MARHLGLDIGGTAARWHLIDGDNRRSGEAPGFSGHLFQPEVLETARRSLAAVAGAAGGADMIVAGVTGLTAPSVEAALLRTMLIEAFGARSVVLMSDIELAFLGAFEPGGGIIVYAGTGSIAAHLSTDGRTTLIGGKGVVIDDAGGGHWIATRALRSVLRREDSNPGSAWDTPLGRALAARLGGADWTIVRRAVYGADRGTVGRLAIAVGEAAGDPAALAILYEAGAELAALAATLEARVAKAGLSIALAGRAASLHPAIFEAFAIALPGRVCRLITLDAAAQAARLAARPDFQTSLKNT